MRVHVCVHMNVHQMPKAKATGLIEGCSGIVIDRKRQRRQVVCCSVCVRECHSGVMTPHGSRTRGWDSLLTPCCQLRGGIKEEEEEEEWWRWKRRRWCRQLLAPQDSNWLAERMTHTHNTHTQPGSARTLNPLPEIDNGTSHLAQATQASHPQGSSLSAKQGF